VLLFSRHACYPGLVATSDESAGLDRLLTMKAAQDFSVEITAHPRSGAALSRLVTAPAGGASAIASSTMVDEVADQPAAAIDGDPETAWVAGFGDPTPSLTLRWPTPRPITGIRLASPFSLVSSRPLSVTVQVDGGTSVPRVISPAGLLAVSAKAARSVTLTFTNRFPVETLDPVRGVWVTMPMGVAEVSVLGGPPVAAPVSTYPAVVGRCGTGPALEVDGVTVRTRFTTTLADLRNGVDVKVEPCRGGVRLAAGDHRIRVLSSPGLEVAAVRFQPIETPPPAAITTSPEVIDWQAADRTVAVRAALMPRTLELAESTNPGWTATMGTTVLAPVVVDGWRQAWVVPAGADGQVHLEFVPDRTYRRGLVVGLLAVVVLVGLAAAPRRRTPPAPAGPSSRWGQAVAVLALLAAVWTAGWAGAVAAAAAWLLLRRRPRGAPWVAAGGVLLSALPAAGWVWPSGGAPAVTWWLAAAGVGAALGAMAAVVGRGRQESDLDPSAGTAALG
jgi:arabinofuranan 3-O-arabinosyltransferase